MLDTVIRFFPGGWSLHVPDCHCACTGGLAITLERFLYLGAVRRRNRVAFERGILPALQKRDYQRAMKAASSSDSAIASVLGAGIARLINNCRREDVEYAMEEGG